MCVFDITKTGLAGCVGVADVDAMFRRMKFWQLRPWLQQGIISSILHAKSFTSFVSLLYLSEVAVNGKIAGV